jgi:putative NADH-flavin reductase
MIVTIFGATGLVGKQVVKQALANGHTVKAFGRNVEQFIDLSNRNKNFEAIKGYVFDEQEVLDAVKNSDAVISTLGGSFDGTDKVRSLGLRNIARQMTKAGIKRIIALGGMGILNADENTLIIDTPNYPQMYLPVGREHQKAYEYLVASDVDWTFICAPDIIDDDANYKYTTKADYLPEPNYYKISSGNLAAFMLTEISQNLFLKRRVGISNR